MKKIFTFVLWVFVGVFTSSSVMALCVNVPETELYMGPGFQYAKSSWKLSVNTPLRKLDSWDDWYKVSDVDGDIHWVHTSSVIQGYFCVIVKVQSTALRNGPGERYEKIMDSEKYEAFRLVKKQGPWSQVANEEEKGFWILSSATWVQ
ncbi:MAG: hypothetical protein HQM13_02095 [SAR324 cluster bacterium]|nr:hypothetical protein [SAR324 cluster bacterium]